MHALVVAGNSALRVILYANTNRCRSHCLLVSENHPTRTQVVLCLTSNCQVFFLLPLLQCPRTCSLPGGYAVLCTAWQATESAWSNITMAGCM
jgi:hypothetical protein